MKKIIFACFLLGTSLLSTAQHCPFDGSTVVIIKVVDKNGKPLKKLKTPITLMEKPNPVADSCTYAAGQLNKPFGTGKEKVMNAYDGAWKSWSQKYVSCSMFKPGYYAVLLSMAERDCMLKHDNDFNYRKREFVVSYTEAGTKKVTQVPVDAEKMYSLCTGAGNWCRIDAAVTIVQ